ncbi:tRNA pseudouridine(55) synthase TruB [Idiomarina abyssalis]|uniref:tRNA pseudouridine(55) synthase TruB n=1 Tax=Idiomarina abyssalis TaxID=86102 RepID=UPI001C98A2E9|nr:tRNA pseudouridine(55) synthase TruB [Idiomarina abyssalis]MDA6066395.1 tRNA pseudouridine(55) synthase TruB [Idiomarina abyssalis]QZN91746.1 tRNA pseudouridine(55) synthase TruB [Idiomarina abyssalis]
MSKARLRKGRAVTGVVLLNKPQGMSSNHALQHVKRLYNAQKAGHTGALDPLATGILPICLGEATKFSQYLLDADKAYRVEALLGVRTTTSDAEGEVVEEKPVSVDAKHIAEVIQNFIGKQAQSPSIYSALKHEGRPLYYYARRGIEVPKKTREITIHSIELLAVEGSKVVLQVSCSKGTYIRTLVDDLGQALGCGAHVSSLHRNAVADINESTMVTPEQLEKAAEQGQSALDDLLQPADLLLGELPKITVTQTQTRDFLHGQPIPLPVSDANEAEEWRVLNEQSQFLGVGRVKNMELWPRRVIALEYADL